MQLGVASGATAANLFTLCAYTMLLVGRYKGVCADAMTVKLTVFVNTPRLPTGTDVFSD